MQAAIDSTGLKHLNRALTCLSKYGDELVMIATHETFALSSTNQSQSAYGRFKYPKSFFSRYRLEEGATNDHFDEPTVTCQIITRPLLQIIKHKTIEKSCEKCELVISDGASQEVRLEGEDEEHDTLESRLTVRLHCKHGVVKTHRVPLNPADNLMFPMMPDVGSESRLTIGPKALKNMLEHFPFGKGSKSDPQLIWNFTDTEVQLRSLETSVDAKGRANLTTELTISAEEFDDYWIQSTPATIAFHLREFNATIAFAEASSLSLEIRFTEPDAPIYIDAGGDLADTLFVIAASTVQSVSPYSSQARQNDARAQAKGKKRPLEGDTHQHNVQTADRERVHGLRIPRPMKPMKVVHRADRASIAREMQPPPSAHGPQPSWSILTAAQQQYQDANDEQDADGRLPPSLQQPFGGTGFSQLSQRQRGSEEREPLFLPGSQLSQLPPAAEAAIIESGLGIENMTAEELADMLEGDADEVEFATQTDRRPSAGVNMRGEEIVVEEWQMMEEESDLQGGYGQQRDSFELLEDVEMEPTQKDGGTKAFRPLFED
ncbi:Rad9-domain-containing protein [Trametes meyenii]|nr:Rad9-domain-containing protein [Trametes meyenii]